MYHLYKDIHPTCILIIVTVLYWAKFRLKLDPYMDDTFITSAFASMGEAVVSVKLIKNRGTGSVSHSLKITFYKIHITCYTNKLEIYVLIKR